MQCATADSGPQRCIIRYTGPRYHDLANLLTDLNLTGCSKLRATRIPLRQSLSKERTLQRKENEDQACRGAAAWCRPYSSQAAAARPTPPPPPATQKKEEMDSELGAGPRDPAIRDLKKKLASKKISIALKGQDADATVLRPVRKGGGLNPQPRLQISSGCKVF